MAKAKRGGCTDGTIGSAAASKAPAYDDVGTRPAAVRPRYIRAVLPRVIPCLLLQGRGLVKTRRFKDPVYLGDPVNIIKIFNDKEVDELVLLDIQATRERRGPDLGFLAELATEAFVPLAYGGGITALEQMRALFACGFEKVVINTSAAEEPELVSRAADAFGAQSVVVSVDVRQRLFGGYEVVTRAGHRRTGLNPVSYAVRMQHLGAGELLLTAVHRDGTMRGYDLALTHLVASAVDIPVVACGGARGLDDFRRAVEEAGASAVAAGSMFVFHGTHRAVLISFPSREEIAAAFSQAPGVPLPDAGPRSRPV